MDFVVGFSGIITEHALVALLSFGALVILNFVAAVRIIHQAGYARWWVILPFIPFALTIANFVTLWNRTHSFALGGTYGFVGLNEANIGIIFRLDEVALGVSWAAFLVFAFLRWPVSGEHDEVVESAHRRTFRRRAEAALVESVVANNGGAAARAARPAKASKKVERAPAETAPAPRASGPPLKHCVWCGDPLPGSRALFHDCGDKDAPPVFCAKCGTALSEENDSCLQCA
jgi:hypothetical protein